MKISRDLNGIKIQSKNPFRKFQMRIRTQVTKFSANELIPWSRVLLEKLTVTQLVKKFLAVYGARRFITVFKTANFCIISYHYHNTLRHRIVSYVYDMIR